MIIKFFSIVSAIVILGAFSACTSSQDGPTFVGDSEVSSPGDPSASGSDNGGSSGSGDSGGGSTVDSIDALISGLTIPGADSDAFSAPSGDDLTNFNQLVRDVLGATAVSTATLDALNYEQQNFSENGDTIIALTDKSGNGGGTFLINETTDSQLVIEVPHPLFDENTLDEGLLIFKNMRAKALFIAGTHRCANSAESSCSGTTDACGTEGPYRISDVAHATDNFFHEAHKAANDTVDFVKFISLHGFSADASDPRAIVSNGSTTDVGAFAFVNQLATAIDDSLSDPDFAVSCNKMGDPDSLCGTTNVQGRYTNGSSDECTDAAPGFNGRFIHLEQASSLRTDSTAWQLVSDAIDEVF